MKEEDHQERAMRDSKEGSEYEKRSVLYYGSFSNKNFEHSKYFTC